MQKLKNNEPRQNLLVLMNKKACNSTLITDSLVRTERKRELSCTVLRATEKFNF